MKVTMPETSHYDNVVFLKLFWVHVKFWLRVFFFFLINLLLSLWSLQTAILDLKVERF